MPATLFDQLTAAFRSQETRTTRGLLERAAKQSADVIASGDHARLTVFCAGLALVHIDTESFELTPELLELRGYLAALVQLTRAALERADDLDVVRQVRPVDYRPALLSAIKKEGAARHDFGSDLSASLNHLIRRFSLNDHSRDKYVIGPPDVSIP